MAEPYRVIVTGSRTWADYGTVEGALDDLWVDVPEARPFIVIHGACPQGADEMASRWCAGQVAQLGSTREERHPARWGEYGKAAGFRRNAEMVALGADVCLAFIMECRDPGCRRRPIMRHGSHGASHCAELADKAGIPVRIFRGSLSPGMEAG